MNAWRMAAQSSTKRGGAASRSEAVLEVQRSLPMARRTAWLGVGLGLGIGLGVRGRSRVGVRLRVRVRVRFRVRVMVRVN